MVVAGVDGEVGARSARRQPRLRVWVRFGVKGSGVRVGTNTHAQSPAVLLKLRQGLEADHHDSASSVSTSAPTPTNYKFKLRFAAMAIS